LCYVTFNSAITPVPIDRQKYLSLQGCATTWRTLCGKQTEIGSNNYIRQQRHIRVIQWCSVGVRWVVTRLAMYTAMWQRWDRQTVYIAVPLSSTAISTDLRKPMLGCVTCLWLSA